jgi:hypothetical protein
MGIAYKAHAGQQKQRLKWFIRANHAYTVVISAYWSDYHPIGVTINLTDAWTIFAQKNRA